MPRISLQSYAVICEKISRRSQFLSYRRTIVQLMKIKQSRLQPLRLGHNISMMEIRYIMLNTCMKKKQFLNIEQKCYFPRAIWPKYFFQILSCTDLCILHAQTTQYIFLLQFAQLNLGRNDGGQNIFLLSRHNCLFLGIYSVIRSLTKR